MALHIGMSISSRVKKLLAPSMLTLVHVRARTHMRSQINQVTHTTINAGPHFKFYSASDASARMCTCLGNCCASVAGWNKACCRLRGRVERWTAMV
eukprot:scaffold33480_cov19-Tisochrysis_lutea.AAC.1